MYETTADTVYVCVCVFYEKYVAHKATRVGTSFRRMLVDNSNVIKFR